jgi:putative sugar O-methyltransferase
MTDWVALNARLLEAVAECDPVYRPTNFWTPGLRQLVGELESRGLESFKAWPASAVWFYPHYGLAWRRPRIAQLVERAVELDESVSRRRVHQLLSGVHQAERDFDVVRLCWDQSRWPFDLENHGESQVGRPRQRFPLLGDDGPRWTKPYLNYLLCLAALSRHVTAPPTSFLEIGGGFGVLGEIVTQRGSSARYVNLDIPPLLTVSSFYLCKLLGDKNVATVDDVPAAGPFEAPPVACLPNWRIDDLRGHHDVFVNSFSFQEMEPDVVERYVTAVAGMKVRYVVSLNSRAGKRRAAEGLEGGVVEPVTSDGIVSMFQRHGYAVLGRYREPLIRGAGEIAVLSLHR